MNSLHQKAFRMRWERGGPLSNKLQDSRGLWVTIAFPQRDPLPWEPQC